VHKLQCWQGNYSAQVLFPGLSIGCSSNYTIYSALA
jgi:hypothetical protein